MKTKKIKKLILNITTFLTIAACASHSRPTLFPNETLKKMGQAKANEDIDKCLKEADEYLKTPEGKKVAKGSSGYGTAVGTSVGFGMGTTGVGLGMGVGGGDRGMSSTDVKRNFVNQCLVNKGYQVLAWD
jgi:outer membrane lipoprotein SlyB